MPHCVLVTLGGEIDTHTAVDLDRALLAGSKVNRCMVIDLGDVTGVDSAGLDVLVGAHDRATELDHRLILVQPPGILRDLLAGLGIRRTMSVCETLDEVLAAVANQDPLGP